ncbi:MAG TPA: hypothetical protein VGE40_08440 [Bacilli bacterium]
MSRKWERMIQKNTKVINKSRKKQGQTTINDSVKASGDERFRGKNFIFPGLLIGFSLFYLIAFAGVSSKDNLYWLTSISYLLLGLIIYFFRRPFLTVGKTEISSKRFGGVKYAAAGNIEQITLSPGYVVISIKGTKRKWVFTKMFNRFNTEAMSVRLRQFAAQNSVTLIEEAK